MRIRGLLASKGVIAFSTAMFFLISCAVSPEKKKESAEVFFRTGEVHFSEKNYPAALEELIKAVKLNPEEPTYRNLLGLTYFGRRMYSDAIVQLGEAIRLNAQYSEAHVNLGAVYLELKEWDNAIPHFEAAKANIFYRTPEVAYINLGWAQYNKGDYQAAIANYKSAINAVPNYSMAYYNMGLAYEKSLRLDDAVSAYQKAVSLSPAFLDAHYNLAVALVKKKDKKGARPVFEKVIELSPDSEKAQSAREYLNLMK